MLNFTTLPPLSLYIHYPWCAKKCPYCDFNSHAAANNSEQSDKQRDMAYVKALLQDLQQELPSIWGRTVQTVFIGGGTPSLIHPDALHELISHIRALLNLPPMAEITMEANPGTVDQDKFTAFRQAGITRLSMGIQSFDDVLLQRIGRIHNSLQAKQAINRAQEAGFDNINLDLMYALPGQSLKQALDDVQQALDFDTAHLSHYQLTLEPNTLFASQPPQLPDDDLAWDMQLECQQLLRDHGLHHYEISAYSKPGQHSRHNLNYWQFGDYMGIGAGAHGKISDASRQSITRRWKVKHPAAYLEKAQNSIMIGGAERLSRKDIGFEFMLNASRLVDGFDTEIFALHTGLAINQIAAGLQKAVELDLIEWELHHIKPTERGLRYLNELQAIFL